MDNPERRFFAKNSHEILIEQTQFQKINLNINKSTYNNFELIFKKPVKAIFWNIIQHKYIDNQTYLNLDLEVATKRFILMFFPLDTYNLGEIFIKINTPSPENFTLNHLNIIYQNVYNKNDKNLVEIVNSAYINKSNVSSSTITIDDITVPELLPIEILSLPTNKFTDNSEQSLFKNSYGISRISSYSENSEVSENYDILVNDLNNYGIYIDGNGNTIEESTLKIGGINRFTTQSANYFNLVQPYQHFTSSPKPGIYCYSFALRPTEHNPSGVCNLSKINSEIDIKFSKNFDYTTSQSNLYIYALNYAFLKIFNGTASLEDF